MLGSLSPLLTLRHLCSLGPLHAHMGSCPGSRQGPKLSVSLSAALNLLQDRKKHQ